MASVKERLWMTLADLKVDEFKQLKWFLQQADIMHTIIPHFGVCPAILAVQLERADRQDVVVQMEQTYGLRGALEVTSAILTKISRNDLVQQLREVAVEDVGHTVARSIQSQPTPQHAADIQNKDLLGPPRPVILFQQTLQSNLQNRFMCIQEGLSETGDKTDLDDIYTELYIAEGNEMQINSQHEIRQIEMASTKPAATEMSIRPCDIFKHPSGKYRPVRTVLTNGIAGIGKTFLVHKFILDWAERRTNQDVHLIFPFTFRQLNLLKGRRLPLAKLINKCIYETKDIKEDVLNGMFKELQMSGNSNYDKSKYKLLFVLDGLDENRLQLDFSAQSGCDSPDSPGLDVTRPTGVEGLLVALISGTLLPPARLWITTRPAAANQIPLKFVDVVSEVRGFTEPQKEVYFTKRFSGGELAGRIISHIRASRSLLIMCHIPVFCWITAMVLEDLLTTSERGELPKTLTEMYTEFLAFQIRRTREKYGTKKSLHYIQSLAKLAYHQLVEGNLIFYEEDLKESGIDVGGASVCSGVFTQIFRKESWRRKDKDKGMMFSFVHLSVQEYLAALYVELSLLNSNKNVMADHQPTHKRLGSLFSKSMSANVHRMAIDKTLESRDGHLDLFLRFLLGLSLQTNQDLLTDLLKKKRACLNNSQEIISYIKTKIRENPGPEISINLFHCLNELNDNSLVEEIQHYLTSGSITKKYLSTPQWSALVFSLSSSEKQLDVFDLKKFCVSEDGFLRLLPAFQASTTYLLSGCNLNLKSCAALASVLSSKHSNLRELDFSSNDPRPGGVKRLADGMKNPNCKLEILRLRGCELSQWSGETFASVLHCKSSHLRELDLSNNRLLDKGVQLLSAGLLGEHCRLEGLGLSFNKLSWVSCESLASVLSSQSSCLKELDLSNNDLQDSGVKLLSAALESPHCALQALRLSGCLVTAEGCAALASALSSNPSHLRELDLSYNDVGESGASLLTAGLDDPTWSLAALTTDHGGVQRIKSMLLKYSCDLTLDINTAHKDLVFSEDNRKVSRGCAGQPRPDHPDRFEDWFQLLCQEGLTGRCCWEVEWSGRVRVAAAYRGILRSGNIADCSFGWNDKSWSLECFDGGYYAWHNETIVKLNGIPFGKSEFVVLVYLDWPAGTLSFYRVDSSEPTHLYTFRSTFTEPLYPGFWLGDDSSVTVKKQPGTLWIY